MKMNCPHCGSTERVNLYRGNDEMALKMGFKAEPYAYSCKKCGAHYDASGKLIRQDTRSGEPNRPQPD